MQTSAVVSSRSSCESTPLSARSASWSQSERGPAIGPTLSSALRMPLSKPSTRTVKTCGRTVTATGLRNGTPFEPRRTYFPGPRRTENRPRGSALTSVTTSPSFRTEKAALMGVPEGAGHGSSGQVGLTIARPRMPESDEPGAWPHAPRRAATRRPRTSFMPVRLIARTDGSLTVAEVMGLRKRRAHLRLAGGLPGERGKRDELVHDHVAIALEALEAAAREKERLAANERPEPLVGLGRDDQVHLAVFVLEQHEDDAVRRRRPLARDDHAGHRDPAPVLDVVEVGAR